MDDRDAWALFVTLNDFKRGRHLFIELGTEFFRSLFFVEVRTHLTQQRFRTVDGVVLRIEGFHVSLAVRHPDS